MFEIIYRYDPERPRERRPPRDPAEARRILEAGNHSFASLADGAAAPSRIVYLNLEDVGLAAPGCVPAQQPFAAVLGCSDARVPIEMIFERTCNELFVARVAGNIISPELLGSIDYAVEHLGESLKLIVVLGHSQCGAVTAAVDAYLAPAEYLGLSTSHYLRSVVNTVLPAVRGAARALAAGWGEAVARMPGYREALVESAAAINAGLAASILRSEFAGGAEGLRVVFGLYDLASRRVRVSLPRSEEDDSPACLLDAPAGGEEFRRFASQVTHSPLITQLLRP